MPYLVYPSMYVLTDDYFTEVFVNYQLNYLVDTALFSLEYIINDHSKEFAFENTVQYYRFFVDHLMMCLGQINDYLVPKVNTNDFINLNRNIYNFSDSDFPIISDKKPRNLVEHLGERNNITIENYGAVGGFNVLFINSDPKLEESIKNNEKLYPYTLDLNNQSVIFSDNQNKKNGSFKNYSIALIPLKGELETLKDRINTLKEQHNTHTFK